MVINHHLQSSSLMSNFVPPRRYFSLAAALCCHFQQPCSVVPMLLLPQCFDWLSKRALLCICTATLVWANAQHGAAAQRHCVRKIFYNTSCTFTTGERQRRTRRAAARRDACHASGASSSAAASTYWTERSVGVCCLLLAHNVTVLDLDALGVLVASLGSPGLRRVQKIIT
jgi:hypothetical protein